MVLNFGKMEIKTYQGKFKNDKYYGDSSIYYDNGNIYYEGHLINGLKSRIWKTL